MRNELEKLRKEKEESDETMKMYSKENRTLTNLLEMEQQKSMKAEQRAKKDSIKADGANRDLKTAQKEIEKLLQTNSGLMEKVHLQGETNKNLFKELEVSFLQGDVSQRLSEDLGDMKIAFDRKSGA